MTVRRAVFLDRDGVLNRAYLRGGVSRPPRGVDELEVLPGVGRALRRLKGLGLTLVVVTNQPDVARGAQTRAGVESIHAALRARLPLLDAFFVCYHDASDGCACRKPRPGMVLDAAGRLGIDPGASFLVGDRWSDVAAGRAAGCRTVLVDGPDARPDRCTPDHLAADLPAAAGLIARRLAFEPREVRPASRPVPGPHRRSAGRGVRIGAPETGAGR